MFKNHFKVAIRNLLKNKGLFLINISGLALGIACSLLILLWVQNERSYDRFHEHASEIYRVIADDRGQKYPLSGARLAAAMEAQIPSIQTTVRLKPNSSALFEAGNRKFEERAAYFADPTFFRVFSFPLLAGDTATALNRPDGLLLTERTARKYFGSVDVLGKTLRMNDKQNFTVSGVLQDIPANSHLQFDVLMPMPGRDSNMIKGEWQSLGFYTYVLLKKDVQRTAASIGKIDGLINDIYKKAAPDFLATFRLQPLLDVHLHSSDLILDMEGHGNMQYVNIFTVIAIFILLVACINFINLATARSTRRAKEIGLRKVIGALRMQLVWQFLTESILITFFAILLAIGIVLLVLPVSDSLFGKHLNIGFGYGRLLTGLVCLFLLTSLVSGSYPALFLSSFKPVKVLKGGPVKQGKNSILLRNMLVVVQFTVSVLLIVATTIIYNQLHYMRHRDLGYDKENLVYMPLKGVLSQKIPSLRAVVKDNGQPGNSTFVSELPIEPLSGTVGVVWDGKSSDAWPMFSAIGVDENFLNVFKVHLLSGRWFSSTYGTDSLNYVINEKALHLMGFDAGTAIGQPLSVWGHKGTIIGIVKDFNFKPLQQPIEPLVMLGSNTRIGYLVTRAKPGAIAGVIDNMKRLWMQYNASYDFEYGFIDQDLAKRYDAEQRLEMIFNFSALLAIFISCLGLIGLAAFIAEQRTKEVGIRKVLGASVSGILFLVSKNFLWLVLLAAVIATPLAWYGMNKWLDSYAFRINISWWIFPAAGLIVLLITLCTISFHSIRTAMVNPVKSLRTE